ncbi:hypothetical protein FE257_009067 [Aspergillus nanangensis]|uniref:Uncharacterized protein n=1 Tax=Aspergillus nanangensis TaxID=2582783 RepID=A0AAD4CWN3_ASPNN|nr:hypothetical protein FE257_009067 [Aspergillus nanangensis]
MATVVNGQIFTPGLAIIDAPQPNTPLGGDTLHIAIEVSGNGQLPLSSSSDSDSDTEFHNITLFLTSNDLSKNFTISNGTSSDSDAYVGPILGLEPSSTVKHVDWTWPECFVGDGDGGSGSARGDYNISMHQFFRWNGTDYYTVMDLPISVSNSISDSDDRVDCAVVENKLLEPAVVAASNASLPGHPWLQGNFSGTSKGDNDDTSQAHSVRTGVKGWALLAMVFGSMLLV